MSDAAVALRAAAEGFEPSQWQIVYDTTPLAYAATLERFPGFIEIGSLGTAENAERLGQRRVNFLYHCGCRLATAVQVLSAYARGGATDVDVVSGYGPFITLVSPASLGLGDDLVTLWDDDRRRELLIPFARLVAPRDASAAHVSISLPDTLRRMEIAIALESVRASLPGKPDLAAWYVDLCRSAEATTPFSADPDPVLRCQRTRLVWLGYRPDGVSTGYASGVEAVSIARRIAGFDDWMTGLLATWSTAAVILFVFGQNAGAAAVFVTMLGAAVLAYVLAAVGQHTDRHAPWRLVIEAAAISLVLLLPPIAGAVTYFRSR